MASLFVSRPEVREALNLRYSSGANPLVVCGPPGCGKSTSVRVWAEEAEQRVLWVSLVDARTPEQLSERLATAIGPLESTEASVVEHSLRALGDSIVVLDDFDRLVDDATEVLTRWRDAAPKIRWVVTSRQRVVVEGAEFVDVGPMSRDEAVELFERRARAVRPGLDLDDELQPIVEKLVDELDRIPLAVELAAARVNTLGAAEILRRLPQRFRILRGRETTLRKAIALSWELLDEWEREVLRQAVVFRGGFSLAAAEEVVELPEDAPWVVDVLGGLVEKSLLRSLEMDEIAGEVRFEMLASIREFVVRQGELDDDVRSRHVEWTLRYCRELTYAMRRRGGAEARARLELEQDNLLAALDAAVEPEQLVELALLADKLFRLIGTHGRWGAVLQRGLAQAAHVSRARLALVHRALGELHMLRGNFDDAQAALEAAAEAAGDAGESVTLAWTHFLRGELERRRGRPDDALASLDRAIELSRSGSIPNLERMALGHRAGCLVDVGELDAARESVAAMDRLPPSSDLRDEANTLKRVAYAQYYLGNFDEQLRLTREALELARETGDHRLEAMCIQGLGDAAFARQEYDQAIESWGEALVMHRAHGSAELEGALLGNLGNLHHRSDRLDEARTHYRQALKLHAATGAKPYEAVVWFGLGVLEFEQGHLEDAAAALAHAAALHESIGHQSEIGSCKLVAAWVAARMDEDPSELLDAALAAFRAVGDDDWAALVEYSRGEGAVSDAEEVVRACGRALSGEPVSDRTRLHVRAALARSGSFNDAESRETDLKVASDATWFEVDGERTDLRRRRAPRHILARLVELWRDEPGAAIDVHEAFDVGWPGEVATADAAADRVYWAIRTLRKLGLEPFLMTNDAGYLLDGDAAIAVE